MRMILIIIIITILLLFIITIIIIMTSFQLSFSLAGMLKHAIVVFPLFLRAFISAVVSHRSSAVSSLKTFQVTSTSVSGVAVGTDKEEHSCTGEPGFNSEQPGLDPVQALRVTSQNGTGTGTGIPKTTICPWAEFLRPSPATGCWTELGTVPFMQIFTLAPLKRMCLLILLLNGAVMVTEPSTAGAMSSTEPQSENFALNSL